VVENMGIEGVTKFQGRMDGKDLDDVL